MFLKNTNVGVPFDLSFNGSVRKNHVLGCHAQFVSFAVHKFIEIFILF